jgi:hypothetical protein
MVIYDISVHFEVRYAEKLASGEVELCSESCGSPPSIKLSPSNNYLLPLLSDFFIEFMKVFNSEMIAEHKNIVCSDVSSLPFKSEAMKSTSGAGEHINQRTPYIIDDTSFEVNIPVNSKMTQSMLVEPELINRWCSGSYKSAGGSSSIFDGLIEFKIQSVYQNQVEYRWRLKSWEYFGILLLKICDSNETGSVIKVTLSRVPCEFISEAENFFERYYWIPMKRFMGVF